MTRLLTGLAIICLLGATTPAFAYSNSHVSLSSLEANQTNSHGKECFDPFNGYVYRDGQTYDMVSSWYGKPQPTASGVRFNPEDPTMVAHKVLPLGTKIMIENPKNGRTQIAYVVDSGPYVKGRSLDVSIAAADNLRFVNAGVTDLKVKILQMPVHSKCRS